MCGASIPDPPPPPPPPQAAKDPDTTPLKRRNQMAGNVMVPQGSTMLTGTAGVASNQLNIGTTSLLGGGTKP